MYAWNSEGLTTILVHSIRSILGRVCLLHSGLILRTLQYTPAPIPARALTWSPPPDRHQNAPGRGRISWRWTKSSPSQSPPLRSSARTLQGSSQQEQAYNVTWLHTRSSYVNIDARCSIPPKVGPFNYRIISNKSSELLFFQSLFDPSFYWRPSFY